MVIKQELLERIEGEATLEYEFKHKKIDFLKVKFLNFRGMERMLEGRPLLDSLALTPRVCGVCGQAHLITTVRALEDLYKSAGTPLEITEKAEIIRELTTGAEILQNHFKWFYFSILGDLFNTESEYSIGKSKWVKAVAISRELNKIAGMFSGQWPHAAFVRPGGVVSDPVTSNITDTYKILDEMIEFFEDEVFCGGVDKFLDLSNYEELLSFDGDLQTALLEMEKLGVKDAGQGYKRFLTGANNLGFKSGFYGDEKVKKFDITKVNESLENTFFQENGYTYSKSATYNSQYVETGPMARAVNSGDEFIKALILENGDSTSTRVIARVKEIVTVCQYLKKRLKKLNIKDTSFIQPKKKLKEIEAEGVGVFEAARGILIHKVEAKGGFISSYDIITPTVWNLGNGTKENPSNIQKSIIGLKDLKQAEFIFRSFDVCSVCTTQ